MKRLLIFVLAGLAAVSCLDDPQVFVPADDGFPEFGNWSSSKVDIAEFSSLCLNRDGSALFGICDKGYLYSVSFDGKVSLLYDAHENKDYDFEAVTLDPETGDVYIGVERSQKILRLPAPYNAVAQEWTVDTGANDPSGKGIEGLEWLGDGTVMVGNQANPALLVKYSLSEKKNLATYTVEGAVYISDLCYENGNLWVSDTKSGTVFLCKPDGTVRHTWPVGDAITKPEGICVDRSRSCIWFANDDSGDNFYKVEVAF